MRRNPYLLVVIAVTVMAGVLRFRGLDWGLPYAESRPDELLIIGTAFGYGTGDFNPHSFYYPTLFSYLLFVLYGLYATGLLLAGQIQALGDIAARFAADPSPFFLVARGLTAILGTLTIPVLYRLGRRCGTRTSACLAALFLAVSYLHVRDSHFGVTDVPMTAFTVLAMIPILGIYQRGNWRDYVLAGGIAGLAASMKYNAALLALPILLAHWYSTGNACHGSVRRLVARNLWFAALAMIGAFLLTSPFVALDWPTFLRDFRYDVWLLSGEGEAKVGRAWIRHGTVNLWYGVGPFLLLAAAGGVLGMMRRQWRLTLILLAFAVPYYIAVGRGYAVFVRYIVPITPFLCLFAGLAIGEYLLPWLARRWCSWVVGIVIAGVTALVAWPPLSRSLALDRLITQPDTREQAVRYMEARVPSGAVIGWVGTRYGLPRLPESPASIAVQLAESQRQGRAGRLLTAQLEVARRRGYGILLERLDRARLEKSVRLPDRILVEFYPLAYSQQALGDSEAILRQRGYRCVKEFSGATDRQLTAPGMVYDVQDSLYVPYVGMEYLSNPGPTLRVWETGTPF